jgi:hypothetical protein
MRAAMIENGSIVSVVNVDDLTSGMVFCPSNNVGDLYDSTSGNFLIPASHYRQVVQHYLDTVAWSYGYDTVLLASSFAIDSSDEARQTMSKAFCAWRSSVWQYVDATISSNPTYEALLAGIPALDLPPPEPKV